MTRCGSWCLGQVGLEKTEFQFLGAMKTTNVLGHVRLPLRLTAEQVAELLNCQPDSVLILVQKKLLKPLGRPSHNATKFFATEAILKLAEEDDALDKITDAIYRAVRNKNQRAEARAIA